MCKCDECTGGVLEDDHHDNRYEDVVALPEPLPAWVRVVYVGAGRNGEGAYAVELDTDFGPSFYFRGTLRECAAAAVRIDNYDGPNA